MKHFTCILITLLLGCAAPFQNGGQNPVDVGLIEQQMDGFYYLKKARKPFAGVGVAYHEEDKDFRYRIREEWYAKGKLDEEKTEEKQLALFKRAEAKLGANHPVTVLTRKHLADHYFRVGLFIKASPIYEKLLQEAEQRKVALNDFLISMQANLGVIRKWTGQHKTSEKLCRSVLGFYEKKGDTREIIKAYTALASVYLEVEKFEEFEICTSKLLAFSKEGEHNRMALMHYHERVADYHEWISETKIALEHYEKCHLIAKEIGVPARKSIARSLVGMGSACQWGEQEDSVQSLEYYDSGLQLYILYFGRNHPETAALKTWLAWSCLMLGDFERSQKELFESDRAQIKSIGVRAPERLWTLYNLGWLKLGMDDYQKAQECFNLSKSLAKEYYGVGGSNYSFPAYGEMSALAGLNKHQQAVDMGLQLLANAQDNEVIANLIGPYVKMNLANSYFYLRDYNKAALIYEKLMRRQNIGFGDFKYQLISEYSFVLFKLGRKKDAINKLDELTSNLKVTDRILNRLKYLSRLALLHLVKGGGNELAGRIKIIQSLQAEAVQDLFTFTSEHGRMALMKNNNPFDLPCNLGDVGLAHEALFRYKGLVLDSIVEDRQVRSQINDPNLLRDIKRLKNLKRLEASPMSQIEEGKDRTTYIKSLEDTVGGQLAKISAKYIQSRRAFTLKPAQVAERLGKGEVLLDYIRYDKYLDIDETEPHYGVILLAKGIKPRWIALGKAEEIDGLIGHYNPMGKGSDEDYEEVLHGLYEKVMGPVMKELPKGTDRVIICPDGQLNFVNFGTLLNDEEGFVCEDYLIRYVASERDLLQEGKGDVLGKGLVVFANPAFGEEFAQAEAPLVAMRAVEMNDLRAGVKLVPLPGTQKEADYLKEKAGGWKLRGEFYIGRQAEEKQLRAVKSPRVLHLATHGFFLPESCGQQGLVKNPMHRSGLALAGAQKTLEMWGEGKAPPAANDGILTAAEVGMLDLKGTWLVVLSACETGRGEARSGEGVMGLRRGFIQAGAQNLLMTLWSVSDKYTVPFMKDFYEKAISSGDAPTALAEVQKQMLLKFRETYGTQRAVLVAGPFIMSFQGAE